MAWLTGGQAMATLDCICIHVERHVMRTSSHAGTEQSMAVQEVWYCPDATFGDQALLQASHSVHDVG